MSNTSKLRAPVTSDKEVNRVVQSIYDDLNAIVNDGLASVAQPQDKGGTILAGTAGGGGGPADGSDYLEKVQNLADVPDKNAGVENLGLPSALRSLTHDEATQLTNIGESTISEVQWDLVGALDTIIAKSNPLLASSAPQFSGLKVGTADDEGYAVNVAGLANFQSNVTVHTRLQSSDYVSGIFGDGFTVDNTAAGGSFIEADNMRIRKTFRTHIFTRDQVRATNGLLYVSDVSEVAEDKFFPDNTIRNLRIKKGSGYATFSTGELLLVKNLAPDGNSTNYVELLVLGVDTTNEDYTILELWSRNDTTGTVYEGDTIVRISGGNLLLDSVTQYNPFMDVIDSHDTKVRLGNLRGIGQLNLNSDTFGLFASDNVFFDIGTGSEVFKIGKNVDGEGGNGIWIDEDNYWTVSGGFHVQTGGTTDQQVQANTQNIAEIDATIDEMGSYLALYVQADGSVASVDLTSGETGSMVSINADQILLGDDFFITTAGGGEMTNTNEEFRINERGFWTGLNDKNESYYQNVSYTAGIAGYMAGYSSQFFGGSPTLRIHATHTTQVALPPANLRLDADNDIGITAYNGAITLAASRVSVAAQLTQLQSLRVLDVATFDEYIELPTYTDAERPANPKTGTMIWNTDDGRMQVWDGSGWARARYL